MIVVADTSVVLNLCRVQEERILQALFGRVVVPTEVASEFSRLSAAKARFGGLTLPALSLSGRLMRFSTTTSSHG